MAPTVMHFRLADDRATRVTSSEFSRLQYGELPFHFTATQYFYLVNNVSTIIFIHTCVFSPDTDGVHYFSSNAFLSVSEDG